MTSGILNEIREGQKDDVELIDRLTLNYQGKGGEFRIDGNNIMRLSDWICVTDVLSFGRIF
jgi:hypothetical protein